MAITFDNKVQQSFFGTNVLTVSFAVGSYSGHAMLVGIFTVGSANGTTTTISLANTTGMTYNGVNMNRLTGLSSAFGEANENAELWYMADPPTGTHNIVCTMNGTPSGHPNGFQLQAASWFAPGVLTMSGGSSNTSTSASSITISSATGSLVVAGGIMTESHSSTAPADSAGQTARELGGTFWFDAVANSDGWGALSEKAGAASVTISYTQTNRNHATMVGGSIDEAVTSPTGTGDMSLIQVAAQGTGIAGPAPATGTMSLTKVSAQGAGNGGTPLGTAVMALKTVTAQGTGLLTVTGTGAATLKKVAAQGTGLLIITGTGGLVLGIVEMSSTGHAILFEDFGFKRLYDPSKYAVGADHYFVAVLKVADASYPVTARLFNDTDNVLLATVQSVSLVPEEVFSSVIGAFPATTKRLRVDFGGEATHGPFTIYAADLVTDPP